MAAFPSIGLAKPQADRDAELAHLKRLVATLTAHAQWAHDRGQVENLFGRYMYLHSAFRDPEIVAL